METHATGELRLTQQRRGAPGAPPSNNSMPGYRTNTGILTLSCVGPLERMTAG